MRVVHLVPWNHQHAHDIQGRLVLVPNRRAAQALNVPPESLETLARKRLRDAGQSVASRLAAHRAMVAAAEACGWEDPAGAARALAPAVRMLIRAGANFAVLAEAGSPRIQRLARLGAAYLSVLADAHVIDAAQALRAAAALGPLDSPIAVVGYPRLGLDERAFIDEVAPDGSVVVLPFGNHADYRDTEAVAEFFESRDWQVKVAPGLFAERGAALEGFRFSRLPVAHVYANRDEEVRGALARIKALLADGVTPDQIALVARQDAAYGPTVLALAWEFGVPVRALYAVPLSETRLGAWVQLLLETVSRDLPFESTFRFLEHPLSPWFPAEKRAEARRRHPRGETEWRALDLELGLLLWPETDTRPGWLHRLKHLMGELQVRKQAAKWPREALALRTWLEALAELGEPRDERLSRERFADELREVMGLLSVPAQPGRGGVELHTPLSIFGARYAHVFVLGMAENVLPAVVANSPVLDFHGRTELAAFGVALEDASGAARRERLSFVSLLATATESLTCSYARLADNRPVLPSAYFAVLGLEPGWSGERPLASVEEVRRVHLSREEATETRYSAIARALAVERRRESGLAADGHDGIVGAPVEISGRTFSVTELIALSQCPFKWLSRHWMGLTPPDEQALALSNATRGKLYHKTLELAAQRLDTGSDPRQALEARLPDAWRQAEQAEGMPRLPAWEAQRAEHLRALRLAVQAADFLTPEATIAATEQPFVGDWNGLRIKGRVDRIDRLAGNQIQLIDYKTSSDTPAGGQDETGKATIDLQLSLYAAVAGPALMPGATIAGVRYYSLTKGKSLKSTAPKPDALVALAARVKAQLRAGHFAVRPDRDRKACHHCDMQLVCRAGARLARKEF